MTDRKTIPIVTPYMRCVVDMIHGQMYVAGGAVRKLNAYERYAIQHPGYNDGWIEAQIYVQHGGEWLDQRKRKERT